MEIGADTSKNVAVVGIGGNAVHDGVVDNSAGVVGTVIMADVIGGRNVAVCTGNGAGRSGEVAAVELRQGLKKLSYSKTKRQS